MTKKHLSYLSLILMIALFSAGCSSTAKKTEDEQQSTNTEQTKTEPVQEDSADQSNNQQLAIKLLFAPQAITDACTTGTFTFKVSNQGQEDFTYDNISDKLYAIELIWLDEHDTVNILGSSSGFSRLAEFQPINAGQTGNVTLTLISATNCNPSDTNRCNGFESFYPNGSVDLYARIVDADETEIARSGKITVENKVWSELDSGQAYACGDAWIYPAEDE